MKERIYANDANHWHPFPGEEGTVEYIRIDIHAQELSQLAIESKNRELALAKLEAEVLAIRERFEFLKKALDQAISVSGCQIRNESELCIGMSLRSDIEHEVIRSYYLFERIELCPELAAYLKEKEAE